MRGRHPADGAMIFGACFLSLAMNRYESLVRHEDQFNPQNVPDTYIVAPHSILSTQFLLELATHR